jgi:hypothetical protein
MKISELIQKLESFKQQHGDLTCVCYDGLDPSDDSIVVDVELSDHGHWVLGCFDRMVAKIRS